MTPRWLAKVEAMHQPEEHKKVFAELNQEMVKQVSILGLLNMSSVTVHLRRTCRIMSTSKVARATSIASPKLRTRKI